jgi:cytochrome b561
LLLLVVVPLRAVWRFVMGGEIRRNDGSRWLRVTASGVHGLLYLLLVVVPLLGLVYVDAKGVSFTPFGLSLPQVVYLDSDFAESVYQWKSWLAYGLLGLILLHAVAAIAYHQCIRKDEVLRSIVAPTAPAGPDVPLEQSLAPASHARAAAAPAAFRRRSFLIS